MTIGNLGAMGTGTLGGGDQMPAAAAPTWRPIATGPKDKTLVMVAIVSGGAVMRASDASYHNNSWFTKSGARLSFTATHWAPMPAIGAA